MFMWFKQISNDSDVVVSTRIRLARSIDGYNFPHLLDSIKNKEIINMLGKIVSETEYKLLKMNDIDDITKLSLVEQHLISKELLVKDDSAIIINEDSTIVAMINEEDHLRIQSFASGLDIKSCYDNLNKFLSILEKSIKFAINDKYGYITSCPTNVGSAMRVSIMLHLPALKKVGILNKLFEQATNVGISVRGFYGENTSGDGDMYQISNKKTLGISSEEIMVNIREVVDSIIKQERKAREMLKKTDIYLTDEVYRAYGILKNARMIGDKEALSLLSKVRFGVSMNILKEVSLQKVQELIVDTKQSTLKTIYKEDFSKEEEEEKRAEYIRKGLE